jgi:3',5'-cyclic AMP phosphodiesterase CpdA
MLVAQITDIHLGFDPGNPDELNRQRLDSTLEALCGMEPKPDLLLATGDLVDNSGDVASYRRLREITDALPFPTHFALGNHDGRTAFFKAFPEAPRVDGFLQYAIEDHAVRILVLDTLEDGRHGGNLCEARAEWLRERFDEQPDRPTVVVLHHPPIETALAWMTENPEAEWVLRLHDIIAGQDNVVAMLAGHLHRPVTTLWAGTTLAVCPSTAPQVALDLGEVDPENPDDRPMIVAGAPYYALHAWTGHGLVTHFDTAGEHDVIARFGENWQRLLRKLAAEKVLD